MHATPPATTLPPSRCEPYRLPVVCQSITRTRHPCPQDERVQVDFDAKRWARHEDRDNPVRPAWDDPGTTGMPDLLAVSSQSPGTHATPDEEWPWLRMRTCFAR